MGEEVGVGVGVGEEVGVRSSSSRVVGFFFFCHTTRSVILQFEVAHQSGGAASPMDRGRAFTSVAPQNVKSPICTSAYLQA